jgi:hypothetical protein
MQQQHNIAKKQAIQVSDFKTTRNFEKAITSAKIDRELSVETTT